jgi:hypothetical protein
MWDEEEESHREESDLMQTVSHEEEFRVWGARLQAIQG